MRANNASANIGFGVYYPKVLYEYPHLAQYARTCPNAEQAATEALSRSVHPSVRDADVGYIVRAVQG